MLSLHIVEVELGCQLYFHLKSGPSYGFNVVVARMTLFGFSCVGAIVKVHCLSVRNDLSSDTLKVSHGENIVTFGNDNLQVKRFGNEGLRMKVRVD